MPEIDETRLGSLNAIAQIADSLLKNPKTRKKYLEAVKEARPDLPIPEIDAAQPVAAEVNAIREEFTKELKSLREEREKEKSDRMLSSVKESYAKGKQELADLGYTPEGIADVEKFMETNGLTDFALARKAYEYDNPRPAPARPSRGNYFDMMESKNATDGNDYIKKLFETGGQDESVLDAQISTVLAEARQGLGAARAR
jgi:hypothetical protein